MRLIDASEIQTRVNNIYQRNGVPFKAVLLLYKDSRYDMAVLDELYGEYNWQTSYESINGVLFCTISVWDAGKGMWVSKTSNGVPSKQEKEKGEASDALKRAGFLWGIGRELYTAPQIEILLNSNDYYQGKDGGGYKLCAKFMVSKIGYDEKRFINELEIIDQDGNKRYSWTEQKGVTATPPTKPLVPIPETQYFKPMKDFDPHKVYDELVARISKERAGELLKSKGFASPKATWTMTLEQYYDIVKEADKIYYDVIVTQETTNA